MIELYIDCQDENPVVNEIRRKREGIWRPVLKCLYLKRFGAQGINEVLVLQNFITWFEQRLCDAVGSWAISRKAELNLKSRSAGKPRTRGGLAFARKV